jgi:Ser/Thr protein kinase RdoA (MazF antagonist)
MLATIATKYGVSIAAHGAIEGGYRNISHSFNAADGTRYNFILYKNESGIVELIRRTNALGAHLSAAGLPVRTPLDERILQVGKRYGSLYGYLGGTTIPWEAYTMRHIKLLGWAMALFHSAAAGYEGPTLPSVETVYSEILERMKTYFDDPDVQKALAEKLHVTVEIPHSAELLQAAMHIPGRTPLHMDLVRSNVLFREKQEDDALTLDTLALSGILDLEKAAVGHPMFDIARTLAFLLVDCPKPADKLYRYFLDSGYRKRGGRDLRPAQVADQDMLETLVTLFLTYDFYKFLKQNPYESLSKNHHFKRTADILLSRKVLHYSD